MSRTVTQNHSRGSTVFVFEFMNQKEFETFLAALRYCAAQLPEPEAEKNLLDTASKLEYRCDSRFSKWDTAFVAPLFQEEMARFAKSLVELMWVYEDFAKMMDDLLDQLEAPDSETNQTDNRLQ